MLWTRADLRAHVEPGGGALADADLEVAEPGLEDDRAAHDLADPDVAVRGLGDDAGLREVDGDAAVGRVDPQVAVGDADPRVAVGVLDHGAGVELRTRTSPEPVVTSAWPVACSTLMSPIPLFRFSASA